MSNNLFNNMSYMSNYRVFCFSDIVLSKFSTKQYCAHYKIGDFIPTSGYNYIYGPNLLIVDYLNKVVHIVVNSKYYELVKISENKLELFENSFLYRLMFGNYKFKVIDVYGNFLDIRSIEDIIISIMSYPIVEMSFVENNYINLIEDDNENKELLINGIEYLSSNNHVHIKGIYKSKNQDDLSSLTLINNTKKAIYNDLILSFRDKWFLDDEILKLTNEFLKNIRLLYLAVEENIKLPFAYYSNDKKEITHIGKISSYMKDFVLNNDEETINLILDTIFTSVEFEEDYEDFIISTISISIDNINY